MEKYVRFLDDRKDVKCTPFQIPANNLIQFDSGRTLSEITGQIWEFEALMTTTQNGETKIQKFPVIILDTNHGKKMITGRFISGLKARDMYSIRSYILAWLIKRKKIVLFSEIFEEIFDDTENILDHEILRSGHFIRLARYIPGMKSQGDDIKRQPVKGVQYFVAKPTETINFNNEKTDVVSEICVATGSSLEAWNREYISRKTNGKYILYNMNFISINGLKRSLPLLLEKNVTPIIICDEGIFNIYEIDLHLPNGETIKAGTLINIYPDEQNKTIMPRKTYEYIRQVFPVPIMPDLCGEVGEKNQKNKEREVINYDANEFYALDMPVENQPWQEIIQQVYFDNPDASLILETDSPEIYKYYIKKNLISPEPIIVPSETKKVIVEVM